MICIDNFFVGWGQLIHSLNIVAPSGNQAVKRVDKYQPKY